MTPLCQISCNNINTISDDGASQHGPDISSLDCSLASLATLLAIQWHLWTTENLNMISCFCLLYFLLCELSVTAFAHLSFECVVFLLEIWTQYSNLNILSLWCKYFSGCSVFVLLFITCICTGEREKQPWHLVLSAGPWCGCGWPALTLGLGVKHKRFRGASISDKVMKTEAKTWPFSSHVWTWTKT